jgi:hypothetical protein
MTDVHEPAPHADSDAADHLAVPGDPRPWLAWAPLNPNGGISPQLARIILDGYIATGNVVDDVDDDDAVFAATAAQTGRRHNGLGGTKHLATPGHAAGDIVLMLLRWPCAAILPQKIPDTVAAQRCIAPTIAGQSLWEASGGTLPAAPSTRLPWRPIHHAATSPDRDGGLVHRAVQDLGRTPDARMSLSTRAGIAHYRGQDANADLPSAQGARTAP